MTYQRSAFVSYQDKEVFFKRLKLKSNQPNVMDVQKRQWLLTSARLLGGFGILTACGPFIRSWLPSRNTVLASNPVEVDVSHLQPGERLTINWRGRPVWVVRRTATMLAELAKNNQRLRDPDSLVPQQPAYAQNPYRSIKPDYLVVIGVCTHLGCIPNYIHQLNNQQQANTDGFDCPCHGSKFDMAGRVFKGMPAPINLEVPPYRFINNTTVEIG